MPVSCPLPVMCCIPWRDAVEGGILCSRQNHWTSPARSGSIGVEQRWFDPEKPMKTLIVVFLLISSPAWAQTKPPAKGAAARVDNCAPIGRTADGQLVYSMKCENLPALVPPAPPPQAEAAPAPPAQPEVRRSGIFGWFLEVKRPDE